MLLHRIHLRRLHTNGRLPDSLFRGTQNGRMEVLMRTTIVGALVTASICSASIVAAQDNSKVYEGQRVIVRAERSGRYCELDGQTLRLRVANNLIMNTQGTCQIPVRPDGSYEGQCNFNNRVSQVHGNIVGNTLTHFTKTIGGSVTCEYRTDMRLVQ